MVKNFGISLKVISSSENVFVVVNIYLKLAETVYISQSLEPFFQMLELHLEALNFLKNNK